MLEDYVYFLMDFKIGKLKTAVGNKFNASDHEVRFILLIIHRFFDTMKESDNS